MEGYMITKASVKAEFEPHKIVFPDLEACVAVVGYQLISFAGITPPSVQEIYADYQQSGQGNGFRFLAKFVVARFPQLETKYTPHEMIGDLDAYMQKCLEVLGKGNPIGISPGGVGGHVAVLVEVDLQEGTLKWWEAQSGQYRKVTKKDFDNRRFRTYETFYLVKKSNS